MPIRLSLNTRIFYSHANKAKPPQLGLALLPSTSVTDLIKKSALNLETFVFWKPNHKINNFRTVHGIYFEQSSGTTILLVDSCGAGKKSDPPNHMILIPHSYKDFEIHLDQDVGKNSQILKEKPDAKIDQFIFSILRTKYVNAYKG